MWAGDGCRSFEKRANLYRVRFSLHSEDKANAELLNALCRRLFNSEPYYWKTPGVRKVDANLYSKFTYYFPDRYLRVGVDKCRTVALRVPFSRLSKRFLVGFVSGLAITDGCFTLRRFVFSSVSPRLAKQAAAILLQLGFRPQVSCAVRKEPNWAPIWRVRLGVRDATKLLKFVNRTATEIMGRPVVVRSF
jgi:hypothetical protein